MFPPGSVKQFPEKKVAFSNLDKILWPDNGLSKYNLIRYYLEISSYLLPHLYNRFLVFQRFPEGADQPGFYQKNCPQGAPDWLPRAPFTHGSKITEYVLADGPETLAWIGNQACIEIHPWLSPADNPDTPDFAVFDLDPPRGTPFPRVCVVAAALHDVLLQKGLRAYPKTSGSRGIQVYLPLLPRYSYEQARQCVSDLLSDVHDRLPGETTLERTISRRGDKIYLDAFQNGRGKTIVAPYSPRPLPGAPVSTPLDWSEIRAMTTPHAPRRNVSFTMKTIGSRLAKRGDLFSPVLWDRQTI